MRRGKSGPEGGRAGGRRSLAGSADGPRREPRAGAPEPIGAAGACCWARFPRRRRDGRGLGFGPGPPCQVGSGGGGMMSVPRGRGASAERGGGLQRGSALAGAGPGLGGCGAAERLVPRPPGLEARSGRGAPCKAREGVGEQLRGLVPRAAAEEGGCGA